MGQLRREVIIPRGQDAVAFHRRIAVLSICIALLAGGLDAMLWREAQHAAERASIEAEIDAERAELARDYQALQVELDERELDRLEAELEVEFERLDRLEGELERARRSEAAR